ncbi:RNA polymerase III, subunit C17 [Purpureocillium lavendulum]|uniref:DNA-directed RNA polymerase III subunit RPC9 n=1 Tax=Purpureocillium lavendulum TaxID=1247861 RepID=A0AB34FRQ1_9HYPO|nr:RNA polymerase III, subunit C17 [Purpureocillium lavendulum]
MTAFHLTHPTVTPDWPCLVRPDLSSPGKEARVIESQAAVLSNYEVFQHLVDQRQRYKSKKRRGPPNLENVVKELLQYLREAPGPLSQEPTTYTPESIAQLLERLRHYELSKGELVMILNLRPSSVIGLNTVVEDMSERFTEDQQQEMVDIIAEVLGQFETAEPDEGQDEAAEGGDVNMDDAAA